LWLRLRLRKRLRHELPSPAGTVRALGSARRRKREDSIGQSGFRFQVAGAGAKQRLKAEYRLPTPRLRHLQRQVLEQQIGGQRTP
jgi:hypothetical protein